MSINWGRIGKFAAELAMMTGIVALDQTVRSWVSHRVKKVFDKNEPKTEDKSIAVQPKVEEPKADEPKTETEPKEVS